MNQLKYMDLIEEKSDVDNFVNIQMTQRNGRKCITTVSGLQMDKENLKSTCSIWKKSFSCNGSISKEDDNSIILTGNQVDNIFTYLTKNNIVKENQIRIY